MAAFSKLEKCENVDPELDYGAGSSLERGDDEVAEIGVSPETADSAETATRYEVSMDQACQSEQLQGRGTGTGGNLVSAHDTDQLNTTTQPGGGVGVTGKIEIACENVKLLDTASLSDNKYETATVHEKPDHRYKSDQLLTAASPGGGATIDGEVTRHSRALDQKSGTTSENRSRTVRDPEAGLQSSAHVAIPNHTQLLTTTRPGGDAGEARIIPPDRHRTSRTLSRVMLDLDSGVLVYTLAPRRSSYYQHTTMRPGGGACEGELVNHSSVLAPVHANSVNVSNPGPDPKFCTPAVIALAGHDNDEPKPAPVIVDNAITGGGANRNASEVVGIEKSHGLDLVGVTFPAASETTPEDGAFGVDGDQILDLDVLGDDTATDRAETVDPTAKPPTLAYAPTAAAFPFHGPDVTTRKEDVDAYYRDASAGSDDEPFDAVRDIANHGALVSGQDAVTDLDEHSNTDSRVEDADIIEDDIDDATDAVLSYRLSEDDSENPTALHDLDDQTQGSGKPEARQSSSEILEVGDTDIEGGHIGVGSERAQEGDIFEADSAADNGATNGNKELDEKDRPEATYDSDGLFLPLVEEATSGDHSTAHDSANDASASVPHDNIALGARETNNAVLADLPALANDLVEQASGFLVETSLAPMTAQSGESVFVNNGFLEQSAGRDNNEDVTGDDPDVEPRDRIPELGRSDDVEEEAVAPGPPLSPETAHRTYSTYPFANTREFELALGIEDYFLNPSGAHEAIRNPLDSLILARRRFSSVPTEPNLIGAHPRLSLDRLRFAYDEALHAQNEDSEDEGGQVESFVSGSTTLVNPAQDVAETFLELRQQQLEGAVAERYFRAFAFENEPTGGFGSEIVRGRTISFSNRVEIIGDAPRPESHRRPVGSVPRLRSDFDRVERARWAETYAQTETEERTVTTTPRVHTQARPPLQLMTVALPQQVNTSRSHTPNENGILTAAHGHETPAAAPPSPSLVALFPCLAPVPALEPYERREALEDVRRVRELRGLDEEDESGDDVVVLAVSISRSAPASVINLRIDEEDEEDEDDAVEDDDGAVAGSPPSRGNMRYSSLLPPEDPNDPSKEGEEDPFNLDDPETALNTQLNARLIGHRATPQLGIGTPRRRRPSSLKWPDQTDIEDQLNKESKTALLKLKKIRGMERPLNRPTLHGRSASEGTIPQMPRSWERHGSGKPEVKARIAAIGKAAAPSHGLRIKLLESPPSHAIPPRPDPSIPLFGLAARIDSATNATIPVFTTPPLNPSFAARRNAFSTNVPSPSRTGRATFRLTNADTISLGHHETIDETPELGGDSTQDPISDPPTLTSPPIPTRNSGRIRTTLLSPPLESSDEDAASSSSSSSSPTDSASVASVPAASSPGSPRQPVRSMLDIDDGDYGAGSASASARSSRRPSAATTASGKDTKGSPASRKAKGVKGKVKGGLKKLFGAGGGGGKRDGGAGDGGVGF